VRLISAAAYRDRVVHHALCNILEPIFDKPFVFGYCDDFLAFSDDKRELSSVRAMIATFLDDFRLVLHPDKSVVFPTAQGIQFLGYRVFPSHRLLRGGPAKRSDIARVRGRID
jgi:hypothetical protein